jgi:hypothetical protein
MLEVGPLVGMIQIPGIKYGVKNVVALATLVGAIEDTIPMLDQVGITDINSQTEFLAQVLTAWLDASGRRRDVEETTGTALDPQNVVYQGRILVSVLSLSGAAAYRLVENEVPFISKKAEEVLRRWLGTLMARAGFMRKGQFIGRDEFKEKGFLGSGGIAKFRNRLWAAIKGDIVRLGDEKIEAMADAARAEVMKSLGRVKGA